jgi:hypothetical protein
MRWAAAFSIVGAAVLLPSVVAFLATHAAVFKATTALGAAIGFGGLYIARSFRCPKCGADIRESPAMDHQFPWTVNERRACCPQCAVDFDAQSP